MLDIQEHDTANDILVLSFIEFIIMALLLFIYFIHTISWPITMRDTGTLSQQMPASDF